MSSCNFTLPQKLRKYYFFAGQDYALNGWNMGEYIEFLKRPLGYPSRDIKHTRQCIIFALRGYHYDLGVKMKLGADAFKYRPNKEAGNG